MFSNYAHNAFIFNWVNDYDDQVNILKKALEKLKNRVKIYNHLDKEELLKTIEFLMTKANFELYNYIVVVILDNKSKSEYFIKTSDNEDVLINSQFLTKIQQNSSLADMPRLFVIQKLLDVSDMDDVDAEYTIEMINDLHNKEKKEKQMKTSSKRKYLGLTISLKGLEYTDKFLESPFLKVFAKEFEKAAEKKDIGKIIKTVRNVIEQQEVYENIDLQVETNQKEPTFVFGNGIDREVLRDFFSEME